VIPLSGGHCIEKGWSNAREEEENVRKFKKGRKNVLRNLSKKEKALNRKRE
jgi:hypothetical protein